MFVLANCEQLNILKKYNNLILLFFMWRYGISMATNVTLITVHIGNNPLYGYFAAAPVYHVAVHHIKTLFPLSLGTLQHIPLYLPGFDLCADGGDRMNEFVTGFYFTHPEIFKNNGVYPIFGSPECTNQALALADLSREFDLPVFTSVAGDSRLTNRKRYPTTSAIAPLAGSDVLGCVDVLLRRFKWNTLALICDSMSHLPGLANFFYARCVDLRKFLTNNKYNWYNKEYDSAKERNFSNYLALLKDSVRVFVILTIPEYLREFMVTANSMGLTKGEYVFIAIQPTKRPGIDTVSWHAGAKDDMNALEAYKSLLVVTGVVPDWGKIVNLTSEIATTAETLYNFSYSPKDKENDMQIGIYESTRMMAQVFNEQYPAVLQLPKSKFIQKFFNRSFNFAARNFSLDSVGSKINDVPVLRLNLLTQVMEPAMIFDTIKLRFCDIKDDLWYWVNRNSSPPDKPLCGFRGNDCDDRSPTYLGAIVGGVLAVVMITVSLGIYCYVHRYGLQDDQMRWLIDQSLVVTVQSEPHDKASPLQSYLGRKGFFGTEEIYALPLKRNTQVTEETLKKNKKLRKIFSELYHSHHINIAAFFGVVICRDKNDEILLVSSRGGKGSLRLLLDGQMQMLSDERVMSSMLNDLLEGLEYLHGKHQGHHGNLTSLNCIIDSRYLLKLSHVNHLAIYHELDAKRPVTNWLSMDYSSVDLLWKSPDIIAERNNTEEFLKKCSSRESDIYAFGVILLEVVTKCTPYNVILDSEKSVEAAIDIAAKSSSPMKTMSFTELDQKAVNVLTLCFLPPHKRSNIKNIKKELQIYLPKAHDLIRYLSKKLQDYAEELEVIVLDKTRELEIQRVKVEEILSDILPRTVVQQLRSRQTVLPEMFQCVTIMFSDIPAFSYMAQQRPASESISFLTTLYSIYDELGSNFDVYKVETVKDIHLVVSGIPQRNGDAHVFHICDFSLAFLHSVQMSGFIPGVTLRAGINSGPCAAGVIGLTLPKYCLFGDTLNTASRMESTGEGGKIQISQFTRELIGDYPPYKVVTRGFVEVKGKGSMRTYWLSGAEA